MQVSLIVIIKQVQYDNHEGGFVKCLPNGSRGQALVLKKKSSTPSTSGAVDDLWTDVTLHEEMY